MFRRLGIGGIVMATMAASVGVATVPVSAQAAAWTCDGVPATLVGTEGPDVLVGTDGPDVIVARQGDDVIRALAGDDIVCAGKGNDTVFGGQGFDILFGAQGNDTIHAADGADSARRTDVRGARMFGGQGNDEIHGTNRWDRMQGGPGADRLFGYEGRDWMRGGPDNDNVDGGGGIDDLHGGNGRDDIVIFGSDIVRGGAGLDLCRIAAGEPQRLISCGRNVREVPRTPPQTGEPWSLVVSTCTNVGDEVVSTPATGLLTNNTATAADVFITVFLRDAEGVRIGEALESLDDIQPGETVQWAAGTFDDTSRTSTCSATLDVNATSSSSFPGSQYNATIAACGAGVIGSSATGRITNTSGVVSDLFVRVYGFDRNGVRQVDHMLDSIDQVQPGETVEYEAQSFGDLPPGGFSRCTVYITNFDL